MMNKIFFHTLFYTNGEVYSKDLFAFESIEFALDLIYSISAKIIHLNSSHTHFSSSEISTK